MRYCVSDIHGEYEMFRELLRRISFTDKDEMYICGDIVDKGEKSIQLAKLISSYDNIHCIIGNHEFAFLKYYHRTSMQFSESSRIIFRKTGIFSIGIW